MEIDSTVFLEKRKLEWRGKKGYIYIYKYKTKDPKGDNYNLAAVGIIPDDATKLITQFDFNSQVYDNMLDTDEKLDKQLSELVYNTLANNRTNDYLDTNKVDTREEEYSYRHSYRYDD